MWLCSRFIVAMIWSSVAADPNAYSDVIDEFTELVVVPSTPDAALPHAIAPHALASSSDAEVSLWSSVASSFVCVDPTLGDDADIDSTSLRIQFSGPSGAARLGRPRLFDAPVVVSAAVVEIRRPCIERLRGQSKKVKLDVLQLDNASASVLSTLVRTSSRGRAPTHPLDSCLFKLRTVVTTSVVANDPSVDAIVNMCMNAANPVKPSASLATLSHMTGLDSTRIKFTVQRLATLRLWWHQKNRLHFESCIVNSSRTDALKRYLDLARHDETPMPIRITAQEVSNKDATMCGQSLVSARTEAVLLIARKLRNAKGTDSVKLLQSEQRWAMLLKVHGVYIHFRGKEVSELQALENTTSSVLSESQSRISGVSKCVDKFLSKTRVPCTDRFSGNFACEEKVVADRGAGWGSCHLACRLHIDATIHNLVIGRSELDTDVSGMLHISLSLRMASSIIVMQRCLFATIEKRLKIMQGSPPAWVVKHRRAVLNTFCSGFGCKDALVRMLLAVLPNGDLTDCTSLQVYVDELGLGGLPEREVALVIAEGVTSALCPCAPARYPRHRWRGAKVAVDDVGIIEAIAGLLGASYEGFVAALSRSSKQPATRDDAAGDGPLLAPVGPDASAEDRVVIWKEGQAPTIVDGKSPEANDHHRKCSLEYLRRKPLGRIIRLRIVLEPLQCLITQRLYIDSQEWESEQAARLIDAVQAGRQWRGAREYKVTVSASNQVENMSFNLLALAFERASVWFIVPADDRHNGYRSLSFQVLSRSGAAIEELHCVPNRSFPIRKFALIHNPELWQSVKTTPLCMYDDATLAQVSAHFGSEVLTDELAVELEFDADEFEQTIGGIEAKHASLRRLLFARSTQTHCIEFKDANAEWICARFRLWNLPSKRERNKRANVARKQRLAKQDRCPVQVVSSIHFTFSYACTQTCTLQHINVVVRVGPWCVC